MILGVVGAGTMGAGIAQLGCAAGMRTLLHDPLPEALETGEGRVRDGLERWVAKGRADAGAAGLEAERRLFELAMATEDRVEGMNAFVEKRPPEFRGR